MLAEECQNQNAGPAGMQNELFDRRKNGILLVQRQDYSIGGKYNLADFLPAGQFFTKSKEVVSTHKIKSVVLFYNTVYLLACFFFYKIKGRQFLLYSLLNIHIHIYSDSGRKLEKKRDHLYEYKIDNLHSLHHRPQFLI